MRCSMCYTFLMNRRSSTSLGLIFVLWVASLVGLGVFVAWLVRQIGSTAGEGVVRAMVQASKQADDAFQRATTAAREAASEAIMAAQGAMPAGRVDVGDVEVSEQLWEGQAPWYLQPPGYDPTDDRLPDPVSMDNANRTVLVEPGTFDSGSFLDSIKNQPTPNGFKMPVPDLMGEDI